MSHRTEIHPDVVKSVFGIVGVTLTVILLITCAGNLHATTSPTADEQSSAVSTKEPDPTQAVGVITRSVGVITNDPASEPPVLADGISADDGFIPADATLSPFNVDQPAVGKLNPDLLAAIQRAASDAATDGIEIRLNSGWRSGRYQQYLLDQAVIRYGSEQEARKWVDTPELSSHVAGDAVDIAPTAADDWLLGHGSRYGLCQTYANEIWHFELAVEPGGHCPLPKADASDG